VIGTGRAARDIQDILKEGHPGKIMMKVDILQAIITWSKGVMKRPERLQQDKLVDLLQDIKKEIILVIQWLYLEQLLVHLSLPCSMHPQPQIQQFLLYPRMLPASTSACASYPLEGTIVFGLLYCPHSDSGIQSIAYCPSFVASQ
jgi:hypothetical protein